MTVNLFEERRKAVPQRFLSWLDRRHFVSVRSAVLAVTVWLTIDVTRWAMKFAYVEGIDPLGKAAIIGAVTGCVAALQAFAFRDYMRAKDGGTP
jgi:hypothetical protein